MKSDEFDRLVFVGLLKDVERYANIQRNSKENLTCMKCGETGLRWCQVNKKQFLLHDVYGDIHKC